MDEELTRDYRAPCAQCSAVDWGVSDTGQFYCRSCHNVIERVTEVQDDSEFFFTKHRISTFSQTSSKIDEKVIGKEWMIIEGFQFVLMHQADALLAMGVCPQFKDDVLCNFWRRYLQKTKQAYTQNPFCLKGVSTTTVPLEGSDFTLDSDSSLRSGPSRSSRAKLSFEDSAALTDGESSNQGTWSGSEDAFGYRNTRLRRSRVLMTMPRTLALCHLALLWVREAITLGDLLRFVFEKHIPYLHIHDVFPEEMRLYGWDTPVFRVLSIPSYQQVQQEALKLAQVMELPAFPSITQDCLLHPTLLSLRYLADANLPDELHPWVCKIIDQTGLAEESALTFDHTVEDQRNFPICYDQQACALIIVSMKLLFRLNDDKEWIMSKKAEDRNFADITEPGFFSLMWWYETMLRALEKARKRVEQQTASLAWKSSKTLIQRKKDRSVFQKRRRLVEHLQKGFQKLSGPSPDPTSEPSSFIFCWGEGEGSDGPSFHQTKLAMKKQWKAEFTVNKKYWHPLLQSCAKRQCTNDHYAKVEPTLPRMYVWLLGLFSFLLRVTPSDMHKEVIKVERRLMKLTKTKQCRTNKTERKVS